MTSLFLFFAFFSPRITLLVCYTFGMMPTNDTPFLVDLLAALCAPRLLVAWWLYIAGGHPLLIILFILAGLTEVGGASERSQRSASR